MYDEINQIWISRLSIYFTENYQIYFPAILFQKRFWCKVTVENTSFYLSVQDQSNISYNIYPIICIII